MYNRTTKKINEYISICEKEFETKSEKLNEEIKEIHTTINECRETGDKVLSFLPESYQNLHAVNFILEVVKYLRADTIKEAINLYEAHLSDMELKNQLNHMQMATQMQTEQLEIMNNYMEQINRDQAQMSDDIADIKYTQYIEWLRNS